ncbi:MAG: Hsp20/alpha crystallin family protein [Spirochaetia bacterium]
MRYLVKPRINNGVSTNLDSLLNSIFDDLPVWEARRPAVNILEEENNYILEAELPGLSENDIDIQVKENVMTISKKHNEEEKGENEAPKYLIRERGSIEFKRSFVLPKDANPEKIDASFKNGVLTLKITKKEETKPRTIKIKKG